MSGSGRLNWKGAANSQKIDEERIARGTVYGTIQSMGNEVTLIRCRAILAELLLLPPSVPEQLITNMRKGATSLESWLVANPTRDAHTKFIERMERYEHVIHTMHLRLAKGEEPWIESKNPKVFRPVKPWDRPARPAWQTDPTALPKRPPGSKT